MLTFHLPRVVMLTACLLLGRVAANGALAEDWTGFRGTDRVGTATAKNLPTQWGASKNIVWKTELPGLGTSSPVVSGSKIFLTCYSGYGESVEATDSKENLVRHVVCLDRESGKITWTQVLKAKMPESTYGPRNNSRHGYASSTVTTDGERLYVFFGISGVYCLDLDGNTLWNADVGSRTHGWGSATSPLLYENLVIVNASVESSSLIALDKKSGKEVWRVEGVSRCWSSPMLVDADGKQELVLNMPYKLAGFDPATGEELWFCEGIPDAYVCPSVISHDGVVFAIGGRKNTAIAVRPGGRGDVNETHVLWRTGKGSNVSSPAYVDGYLYWFHESRGMAYCLDAKTGDVIYEERLFPRPNLIYSSVTAADGKLFAVSQHEGAYVLAAKPSFELLAVNKFATDTTRTNASIAISNNQLLLRSDKAIYCIGR